MTQTQISRLDYKSINNGTCRMLPELTNVNDITDVNEVNRITLHFIDKASAELACSMFPKSYGGKVRNCSGSYKEFSGNWFIVSFHFNTVFINDVTGDLNESAISKRNKVINKLKSIELPK
jgi:hypothetical protein